MTRSEAQQTDMVDQLNSKVLAVPGVRALYPPKNTAHATAGQLLAFVRGNNKHPLRTAAVEERSGGVRVTVRIGITADQPAPEVAAHAAAVIREFFAAKVNPQLICSPVVQIVSIS